MRLSIKQSVLILSLIGVCAVHTSCTKEIATEESYYQEVTITATANGDIKTKTERQADGKVFWTPGDAISIFYGTGNNGGSRFTSTNTETAAIANFTGKIGVITGGGEISLDEIYFWGVYPYRDDNSCDGTSITTYLPAEQEGVADTFADDLFPTMGRNLGLSLAFYNICGGIRFSVARDDIRSVTFRGNNGEVLAGRVKVVMQNGAPVVSQVLEPETEITLTAPDGGCFKVGKYYYMVALPADLNNGFTMTLETDNQTGTREMTSKVSIKRSSFGSLNSVDSKATFTGLNVPFADPAFKAYCIQKFDKDGDGEVSLQEAEVVTRIDCSGTYFTRGDIVSLGGIEFFTSLKTLRCSGNQLTSLDVSKNTALTELSCYYNQLSSLDISKNTVLTDLWCSYNQLTCLDVSKNIALTKLHCSGNQLTSLDVSKNTALTELHCNDNLLTSLDVSQNIALEVLDCDKNQLTSLDVSKNTVLIELDCDNNRLSSLDVSKNTALTKLDCYNNRLSSLDVSKNTALTDLHCARNQLSSIDVNQNTALTELGCSNNPINSLDVSKNTALGILYCEYNQLSNLDVSKNTALTYLACDFNQLTSLDVSQNTSLTYIRCDHNQLSSLDVSRNTALTELRCDSNQLTSLDVSNNTVLNSLDCSPMPTLETLFMKEGQVIDKINTDRNANYIPANTEIVIVGTPGGSEDIEVEIW